MLKMDKDILFTKSEIQKRVSELARQIDSRYAGRELVIIGVLNGAFIFMADLVRSLQIPCTIDFIRVASYGYASESSGTISLIKDIELDIQGRDVLLVEDIIDTGLTLNYLLKPCGDVSPPPWPSVLFWTSDSGAKWSSKPIMSVFPSMMVSS